MGVMQDLMRKKRPDYGPLRPEDTLNDPYMPEQSAEEIGGPISGLEKLADPYAGIDELFKPNQADELFKQHLLNVPTEEDPSLGKRLLTALAAGASGFTQKDPMAGIATAEHILHDPYNKKVAAYDKEGKNLQALSGIEDKAQGKKINAFQAKENIRKDTSNEDIKRLQAENNLTAKEAEQAHKQLELEREKNRDASTAKYQDRMAGAAEKNAETNKNKPNKLVKVQVRDADGRTVIKFVSPEHLTDDEPMYAPADATSQQKSNQARVVIERGNQIKKQLTDPKFISQFGPVVGRIAKGQIKVGDAPVEAQRLYTALKSFADLQPALHGARGVGYKKDFEDSIGNLERDPKMTAAAIDELMNTANDFIDVTKPPEKKDNTKNEELAKAYLAKHR